jgi:hypothetical protein
LLAANGRANAWPFLPSIGPADGNGEEIGSTRGTGFGFSRPCYRDFSPHNGCYHEQKAT